MRVPMVCLLPLWRPLAFFDGVRVAGAVLSMGARGLEGAPRVFLNFGGGWTGVEICAGNNINCMMFVSGQRVCVCVCLYLCPRLLKFSV